MELAYRSTARHLPTRGYLLRSIFSPRSRNRPHGKMWCAGLSMPLRPYPLA